MTLKESVSVRLWAVFIWLSVRFTGWPLWIQELHFGLKKRREIHNLVSYFSFSTWTLLKELVATENMIKWRMVRRTHRSNWIFCWFLSLIKLSLFHTLYRFEWVDKCERWIGNKMVVVYFKVSSYYLPGGTMGNEGQDSWCPAKNPSGGPLQSTRQSTHSKAGIRRKVNKCL